MNRKIQILAHNVKTNMNKMITSRGLQSIDINQQGVNIESVQK